MTTYIFPADAYGCGHFRLVWPAQTLQAQGCKDLDIRGLDDRGIGAGLDKDDNVVQVFTPPDATAIVLQRVTHKYLLQSMVMWQERGIKVIIDIDDDLSCIHPSNPAFAQYKPSPYNKHSWQYLHEACRIADAVTVTTPALARRYRSDAHVIPNYLPGHYYTTSRVDSGTITWPANIKSHPNDYEPVGAALRRVQHETGCQIRVVGGEQEESLFRSVFGVQNTERAGHFSLIEYPAMLASTGVGIAPLADTKFNEAKSWLKLIEMSACGVPWVASPRADYQRFHKISGAGIFADRPNAWRNQLKRLVTDEVWRKEQSEANREASELFRLANHAQKWADAWGLS